MPPMMPPLVALREVGVRFGGLQALRSASFTVQPGEIHALIGPNGAGKSTLVNCITGYQQVTCGSVRVLGRDIAHRRPAAIASTGVARTFQTPQLFSRLSAIDNVRVALRAAPNGAPDPTTLLRCLGLAGVKNVFAAELPYGQQRLLEVARALACGPALLLADEPAAGLSANEQELLAQVLRDFIGDGRRGVLFIEHNVTLVRGIADRVSVLDRGTIIASGAPVDVLADAKVITAYLGSAPAPAMPLAARP